MRSFLLVVLALLALAAPAAAQQLTVYSSLPLQGAAESQTKDLVRGARLALERAGGQAAGRPIRYVSLDDSTARARTWEPLRVSQNARRAAQDPSAIAYIGEFNSGATAISLPITSEAGLLQLSPSNTAPGITVRGLGSEKGEPDKYYPTGERTYGRIVPHDQVQSRAAAVALKELKVKKLLVVDDGEVYGKGLATGVARHAAKLGIRVIAQRRLGRRGRNASALARAARRADAVFYGGITLNGAPRLWRALASNRRLKLVAGDGVAESLFADRIPRSTLRRTYMTVATLAPEAYPASGQEVFRALGGDPDPYAIYGYEAMSLVLDAINRGGGTRPGTVKAFFETKDRDSVLGRYSILPSGDTTLTTYGLYRVNVRREIEWDRVVDAGPA